MCCQVKCSVKAEVFKILNQQVEYVMVASNKVGLVIGKGGETIKSIIQASGAHVEIDRIAPPEAVENLCQEPILGILWSNID